MKWVPKTLAAFCLLAATVPSGCGSDDIAPGNPSLENDLPELVFYNRTGRAEVVTFTGTASDNIQVETVQISFDNGVTWKTADLDTSAPHTVRDASWAYAATAGELPGAVNTVLLRVADGAENVTTGDPFTVEKRSGAYASSLVAAIGAAGAGEFIALSSGSGCAYALSGASQVIVVDRGMTISGNGFGTAIAAVACTPRPAHGGSPATVLSAGTLHPSLLSVGANLAVSGLRIQGALNALSVADVPGTNIQVTVTNCLFEGQGAWSIRAVDGGSAADTVTLSLRGCQVDAAGQVMSSRGGVLARGIVLKASGCTVLRMEDTGGPDDATAVGAGLWFEGGEALVTETCFERDSVAIAASGGSLVLSSCQVLAYPLNPSWGVDLRGGPSAPVLRRNTLDGNTNFGLRIGGQAAPFLRHNTISGNEGAGIVIDFVGSASSVDDIDLGTSNVGDEGRNDLFGNTHPDGPFQVYVTDRSTPGTLPIPALWNYWGIDVPGNVNLVRSVVYDGRDNPGRSIVNSDQYFATRQN